MNVERKDGFNQVCVWEGVMIKPEEVEDFENTFKGLGTRVQYLESIVTGPDRDDPDTGGRHDIFFAVHKDDINAFTINRLRAGIRWVEDVLSDHNYRSPIYPSRVFAYRSW